MIPSEAEYLSFEVLCVKSDLFYYPKKYFQKNKKKT